MFNNHTHLSENTRNNYNSQYRTLLKNVDDLTNVDEIIKFVETLNSSSSKRMKVIVMINILKDTDVEGSNKLRDYLLELNDQRKKTAFVPKTTLRELQKIVSNIDDPEDKLLLSLYVNHPPVRGDYFNVTFDSNDFNYYDNGSIFFGKLQKVDQDEELIIELTDEEMDIADELSIDGRKNLFNSTSANQFTIKLQAVSKRHFGLKYGVQFYRKLYASTHLEGFTEMQNRSRKLAKQMNHSVSTQGRFYLHDLGK